MFSRAAKSVVKSFGQRKYHAGEENLKQITLIGSTEGINQSASRLAKRNSKLNTIPIYDVAGINKRFLFTESRAHNFRDVESFYRGNSRMLTTMMDTSRPNETTPMGDSTLKKSNAMSYLTDHRLNMGQPDTKQLMETLDRLPIGEGAGTVNRRVASSEIIMPAGDTCITKLTRTMTRILDDTGPERIDRTRVPQKNNVISEITGWRLRPIEPFDLNSMYLASLKKEKERKPKKNTTKVKRRVKKVPHLVDATPIAEIMPFERSKDRKTKICANKCFKKNEGCPRSSSFKNKVEDWTIPSAFTNKKPRLLHDFNKVSDTSRSSWSLSPGGYAEDYGIGQLKRLIAISVKSKLPRFYDVTSNDKTCKTDFERFSDGSTHDKSSSSFESKHLPRVVPIDHATLPLEDLRDPCGAFIGDFCVPVENSKGGVPEETVTEDFDNSYDEHERSSSFFEGDEVKDYLYEKWKPVEKVSSAVRSFLTNLRDRKITEKSRSRVSLDSYNLDELFCSKTFSPASTAIKFPATEIPDEISKNWQDTCLYASCNDSKKDPCTCLKESRGMSLDRKQDPCKKKDPCAKPDPCKKKDPCAKPDPCKKKDPCAKPDPCKKKDPCAKPDPCKKKDPCAKPDPCKKKDPCAKPDPCKKDPCAKPDPCKKKDPCAKPDPCKKDPCAKTDPCKKKDPCAKPDPCKKKDPCAKPDPCKKKDPCAKPDPCKKKDPCAKPDPCKKKDPCAKMSPCPTADFRPKSIESSCKIEKAEKPPDCSAEENTMDTCKEKQCPPVFRAPGCPKESKTGGKICKGNAIYRFKDAFLYKSLLKKKYLQFFSLKSTEAIERNSRSELNVRQVETTGIELPKLYTLDTFGINFNVENRKLM